MEPKLTDSRLPITTTNANYTMNSLEFEARLAVFPGWGLTWAVLIVYRVVKRKAKVNM